MPLGSRSIGSTNDRLRSIIPTAAARSRSVMVAVVLGTALTAGGGRAATPTGKVGKVAARLDDAPDTIRDISRYCQACWRNARLPADKWDDCTQQVFARLLERVGVEKWGLLMNENAEERRELMQRLDSRRDSLMNESSAAGMRPAASLRAMRDGRGRPARSATRSIHSPMRSSVWSHAL